MRLIRSRSCRNTSPCRSTSRPSGHHTDAIAMYTMAATNATPKHAVNAARARDGGSGDSAHSSRRPVRTLSRTSVPAMASCSRKSSMGPSSRTASCRSRSFDGCRRGQKPSCERLFAGISAGEREQFEQRPAAEQIEIVRIDMPIVSKPLARLAASSPAILDPRQPALVEPDPPDGIRARAQDTIVPLHEPHEHHRGEEQPPRAEHAAPDGDRDEDRSTDGCQTRMSKPRVHAVERFTRGGSGGDPGVILGCGAWGTGSFWIGRDSGGWTASRGSAGPITREQHSKGYADHRTTGPASQRTSGPRLCVARGSRQRSHLRPAVFPDERRNLQRRPATPTLAEVGMEDTCSLSRPR